MVVRRNQDIRDAIEEHRLRYWEVAVAMGVAPETLTRWLRVELPPGRRKEIEKVIRRLSDGTKN